MKGCIRLTFLAATLLAMIASGTEKGSKRETWGDSSFLTSMWQMINSGNIESLKELLEAKPDAAVMRAGDGRGPLWWAYEYSQDEMVTLLKRAGASDDETDADGRTPRECAGLEGEPTEFVKQGGKPKTAQFAAAPEESFDPNSFDIPDDEDFDDDDDEDL